MSIEMKQKTSLAISCSTAKHQKILNALLCDSTAHKTVLCPESTRRSSVIRNVTQEESLDMLYIYIKKNPYYKIVRYGTEMS